MVFCLINYFIDLLTNKYHLSWQTFALNSICLVSVSFLPDKNPKLSKLTFKEAKLVSSQSWKPKLVHKKYVVFNR